MKKVILTNILIILISCHGLADVNLPKVHKIKVAVIDTGIDPLLMKSDSLCDSGHKDFTGKGLVDNHGHGTHISGIIDQYAKNVFVGQNGVSGKQLEDTKLSGYCQIIIKYFDPKAPNQDNLENTIKSFRWAIDQKVDIINYSGGGTDFSKEEQQLVLEALNKGIKFVAAAGNERSNIDKQKYYPAMYDSRIIKVGNLVSNKVTVKTGKRLELEGLKLVTKTYTIIERDIASSSNYGESINDWQIGTKVLSRLPGNSFGYMTGTSQATAVKTGKIVREMLSK